MLNSLVLPVPLTVFLFLRILNVMFILIRIIEPLVFGDYPKSMRDLVKERLPIFSEEEKKMITGTLDFIGLNYYTSRYAIATAPAQYPRHRFDSLAYGSSKLYILPLPKSYKGKRWNKYTAF